ncbi:uncharacterized protein L969DRAFT_92980 [Mixia osmundae IAM 14324]|uniref:C3H1-type domain-containing protein n=1 Tax=Mixia osmundae (strain CBS 9802 / IAM 14324 / JCM 22182 / KY 12970) TaxID=764103 RepID=G7DTY8_MIXOS|nr:uncharacterized protein L969DRAFT_92980 [Mixia osmundae IAM 14324]KEI41762.1 hypothetical protein L969DRAFT_92980 [Mixia osmundae IAM 14324]GAA94048.1 hypothetical protein E5Q_00695 [Mixia osmundae IAM 14324]
MSYRGQYLPRGARAAARGKPRGRGRGAWQSANRTLVINNASSNPVANSSAPAALAGIDDLDGEAINETPSDDIQPDKDPAPSLRSPSEEGEIAESVEPAPPFHLAQPGSIVINDVTFVKRGNKLIRARQPGGTTVQPVASTSATVGSLTPKRASIQGQQYIRTKTGNLVRADAYAAHVKSQANLKAKRARLDTLVGQLGRVQPSRNRGSTRGKRVPRPVITRQKINSLCPQYTIQGQCTKGLTCPYIHDPTKVSICTRFLANKCELGESCLHSHSTDAHRMPHCTHFPRCNRGRDCPFPHVGLPADSPICAPFATLGYCEKGLACRERHVRECPEFGIKGTCTRANCKLPHILRRKGPSTSESIVTPSTTASSAPQAELIIDQSASEASEDEIESEVDEDMSDASGEDLEEMTSNEHFSDPLAGNEDTILFDDFDFESTS